MPKNAILGAEGVGTTDISLTRWHLDGVTLHREDHPIVRVAAPDKQSTDARDVRKCIGAAGRLTAEKSKPGPGELPTHTTAQRNGLCYVWRRVLLR